MLLPRCAVVRLKGFGRKRFCDDVANLFERPRRSRGEHLHADIAERGRLDWPGHHVGRAQVGRLGEVLFYSGHRSMADVLYVMNTRGRVTFAQGALASSRTTQVFINFGTNSRLDIDGLAPIGEVITAWWWSNIYETAKA
jgi:hypothetical protein